MTEEKDPHRTEWAKNSSQEDMGDVLYPMDKLRKFRESQQSSVDAGKDIAGKDIAVKHETPDTAEKETE